MYMGKAVFFLAEDPLYFLIGVKGVSTHLRIDNTEFLMFCIVYPVLREVMRMGKVMQRDVKGLGKLVLYIISSKNYAKEKDT